MLVIMISNYKRYIESVFSHVRGSIYEILKNNIYRKEPAEVVCWYNRNSGTRENLQVLQTFPRFLVRASFSASADVNFLNSREGSVKIVLTASLLSWYKFANIIKLSPTLMPEFLKVLRKYKLLAKMEWHLNKKEY